MFSFFRSNKDDALIKQFDDLYKLSDDEKTAVLVTLWEVANSDDEFHPAETKYHKKIGNYLGMNFSSRKLKSLLKNDRDKIYNVLNNMNESQKDWYVITVLGMIYSDGSVIQEELDHVINFLKGIGFSEERIRRNMVNTT